MLKQTLPKLGIQFTYPSSKRGAVNLEKPKSDYGGRKSGGGKGAKSNGLTKEEWAEKDRLTNIRIAKAVAIKVAAVAGKTTPKAIMDLADKLLPYLMNTDVGEKEDPLDPPE